MTRSSVGQLHSTRVRVFLIRFLPRLLRCFLLGNSFTEYTSYYYHLIRRNRLTLTLFTILKFHCHTFQLLRIQGGTKIINHQVFIIIIIITLLTSGSKVSIILERCDTNYQVTSRISVGCNCKPAWPRPVGKKGQGKQGHEARRKGLIPTTFHHQKD